MIRASVVAVGLLASGCRALLGFDDPRVLELDAAVDIDAPPTLQCPASYVAVGGSRYRFLIEAAGFAAHSATCNADLAGSTHLAAIDDAAELSTIAAALEEIGPTTPTHFIGGIQRSDQSAPDAGWLSFTGGALPVLWSAGQPNDTDGAEDNREQVAHINLMTGGLHDSPVAFLAGAICECDGRPIDPDVQSLLP